MFQVNLHILDYDYYFKVTDALTEKNTSSVLLIFNEILNKGFDGHHFINRSKMQELLIGAIRQMASRIQQLESKLLPSGVV